MERTAPIANTTDRTAASSSQTFMLHPGHGRAEEQLHGSTDTWYHGARQEHINCMKHC